METMNYAFYHRGIDFEQFSKSGTLIEACQDLVDSKESEPTIFYGQHIRIEKLDYKNFGTVQYQNNFYDLQINGLSFPSIMQVLITQLRWHND